MESFYNLFRALLVLLVAAVSMNANALSALNATDRRADNLYNLVDFQTKKWCPNAGYKFGVIGHGCYCGYGHLSRKPVDKFDEACRCHDECWNRHRGRGEICNGASSGHRLAYSWSIKANKVRDSIALK